MWEAIKDILISGNAWLILAFVIALVSIVSVLSRMGADKG